MTLLTMLEMIRQAFPEKQEAQVTADLNLAIAQYSEDTRLPFFSVDVAPSNGKLYILDASGQPSTEVPEVVGWNILSSPVKEIVLVEAYDTANYPVDKPDFTVESFCNQFCIKDINNDTLVLHGVFPDGVARLRFTCTAMPTTLTVDQSVADLPEQFHQALVDHVFTKYFALKGVLQQAGWFRASYDASVKAGKRFFNRNIQ